MKLYLWKELPGVGYILHDDTLGWGKGSLLLIPATLDPHADSKVRDVSDHREVETWPLGLSHHSPALKDSGAETMPRNNLTGCSLRCKNEALSEPPFMHFTS